MILIKPGYARVFFELPDDSIIADIGFGHDPVRGATYYIDRDLDVSPDRQNRKAAWVPEDKFIQADVSKGIPLPDKSCDFVVASHILEHMDDPEALCKELMRIGKAGYIEFPSVITELTNSNAVHKWMQIVVGNTIIFIGKPNFLHGDWDISRPELLVKIYQRIFLYAHLTWKDSFNVVVIP